MSLCEGGVSSPLGTGTHSLCSPARWAATRLRLWGLRTLGSGWGPGGRLGKAAVEKPQPQDRVEGGPGGSSSAHQALPPVLPDGEKGAATSLCLAEETEASDGPRRPRAGPWESFSRRQCCCPLSALCVSLPPHVPSPIRKTPGLAPRAAAALGGQAEVTQPGLVAPVPPFPRILLPKQALA